MHARFALILLAVGLLPVQAASAAAAAQEAAAKPAAAMPLSVGGEGPLEITAEKSLEWDQAKRVYRARGAAVARRGDVTISAEELSAHERTGANKKNEIYKMTATGGVHIVARQYQIFGGEGEYDADSRAAILTGKDLRFVGPEETVTARDSLEYWQDRNVAIARGHAVAVRDKRRIEADLMTAQFHEAPEGKDDQNGGMELRQLTAIGNVVITTESDVARGEKAVYDVRRNIAVLRGNVRVTRGASQLNGSVAEVDFKTGISRITTGGNNGRVRALFVPGEDDGSLNIIRPAKKSPPTAQADRP